MNMCQQRYVCLTEHPAPARRPDERDARFWQAGLASAGPTSTAWISSGVTKSSTTGMSSVSSMRFFRVGRAVGRDPSPEDLAHLEAAARRVEALVQVVDPVGEDAGDVATEDARKVGVQQKTQGTVKCLAFAGIVGSRAGVGGFAHG